MGSVSCGIHRVEVTFDEPNLVATAGLLLVATLAGRLGIQSLVNATLKLKGRVGGAMPGRKVLTLVHAMGGAQARSTTRTSCGRGRPGPCSDTG